MPTVALLILLSTSGTASFSAAPLIRPVVKPVRAARLTRCAAVGDEEPLDPRKALEEVGDLLQQVKSVWTEGSSWSVAERDQRQRDLVTQYFRVFVPAVAFSGVQLAISLGMFSISLLALNLSHRGYDDLFRLAQGIPPIASALEQVDPSLGNAAIALLIVELMGPALIAIALAVAPRASASLKDQLNVWGLPDKLLPPQRASSTESISAGASTVTEEGQQ